MNSVPTFYWKRFWRWVSSENLGKENVCNVFDKEVREAVLQGLNSYKPKKENTFLQLEKKYPDQIKLLKVIQTLQNHIDLDCFQLWEILKHYLCDVSYGTPASALQNVAFVDTRPSFLIPNVWKFYYTERLFLLKLIQYIIEFKNDSDHRYNEEFHKIITEIGLDKLKASLLDQFEKVISAAAPSRRIQNDFGSETIRSEWAESNLREQEALLQCILLIANESQFTVQEFNKLLRLFRKHDYGQRQGFNEFLENKHKEHSMRILCLEVMIFMVVSDAKKIDNVGKFIDEMKPAIEGELNKLELGEEHSALLMTWMMLTLKSASHEKLFESHYHHFGATALKLGVFKFLHNIVSNTVFSDKSKCAFVARDRVFSLLNDLCNKFDQDGTLSQQNGVMQLCAELLRTPHIASQFWMLHSKDEDYGVVSLWNTALEYFPYNFSALSILAAGLAEAGKDNIDNLSKELSNLPVYTEKYKPNQVSIVSLQGEDAIIGRDYFPLDSPSYRIVAKSRATIMERKEGTLIHFRTPYSYWTVFNHEIEKALDRKGHNQLNLNDTLDKVYQGTKILKGILSVITDVREIAPAVATASEGVFEVLIRFLKTETTPLPLLVDCLAVGTLLVSLFPKEIHLRLVNTGLLPRTSSHNLTPAEYISVANLETAAVGAYLVDYEQPAGTYHFLGTYIDMLCAFIKNTDDERIIAEILLPGMILILREVLPNLCSWRYSNIKERQLLLRRCIVFVNLLLQPVKAKGKISLLQQICAYSVLCTENALCLLRIIAMGNEQLETIIRNESNWVTGNVVEYRSTLQRSIAIVMLVFRLKKTVCDTSELTPLEQLIFAQSQHKDCLKVVPRVTSYINYAFGNDLAVLCCRLLKKFAEGFQMSLFASLDMTAYQVRVMFLDRLRDEYESTELKVAILEFVATCIGKQPGLTDAFFKLNHVNKEEVKNELGKVENVDKEDSFEGIMEYMAEYLGTVKKDPKLLYSPLLGCIMALFHELWKNNMQVLVKKLRENTKFWEHLTSPLFSDIQPHLKTYSQIFNVLGMELFLSGNKLEPNFKEMLELFFDTNKTYLDTWIEYIFAFKGRDEDEEMSDVVPVWLSLLTSWKDFTTIFCRCLPISLNIAHKGKMVAPCMKALLRELDDLKDGRLVVILSELYVIMLSNWKDDCFDSRKNNAKQIDSLLASTAAVYEYLHPRAKRAILSIGTVAISTLDYEIKGNSATAQSIIRSVTDINTVELEKLFDNIKEAKVPETNNKSDEIPPLVLSLALLEQCLDLYDDMFSGLNHWFQTTCFTNKLLCCLQMCLQDRRHYHTSLAALRCLTAYSRGPFAKDLLLSDVDQFLWLQLLPPKFENNGWKMNEWWRVYSYSLDFISTMVMKNGQFFAKHAITFVGVHLEHLIEAIMLPSQVVTMDSLNLCASTLNLVVQLVKYESRWRNENINSLVGIMKSISACLYQCVTMMIRSRRSSDVNTSLQSEDANQTGAILHRTLEIQHIATLCLLSFSPDLLSLLADPGLDLERWQPLVELDFGAPKLNQDSYPQLTFGILLTAICLLTRSLNHSYACEESPRRRRCSCGSPGERRRRSESLTSVSSAATAATAAAPCLPADERLLAATLHAALTLLASQALLTVRDPAVPSRHKQLLRRELGSELTSLHDFVRKRILCAAHTRPHLLRNKLGAWPLADDEDEKKLLERFFRIRNPDFDTSDNLPPPPPPKRTSQDSMREYILRKQYLDKCAQTPIKEPPSPVSHSTPTVDKKKESRSLKRVSWAETTSNSDEELDISLQSIDTAYSNLTEVQINTDEDYFHFMSVVFLCICQTDL